MALVIALIPVLESEAGVAWTPSGQPPNLRMNQPGDATLLWYAGAENVLVNGGFEQGVTNGWTVQTIRNAGFTDNYIGAPGLTNVPVLSGSVSACLSGKIPVGSESVIYQDVLLPSEATSAVLSWLVWIDDGSSIYQRELRIEVRDLADRPLAVVFQANQNALPFRQTWRLSADLTPFIGQTIRLAFVSKLGTQARLQLDDLRVVTAPMPGVKFDVFLAEGSSVGVSNLLGRTSDVRWQLGDLKSSTTYSWQVVTVRDGEQVTGPVWRFRTGARGLFDHLSVKPVPTPQVVNEGFAFEIVARDALNFMPTDAPAPGTAALDLAALASGPVASRILISEIFVSAGFGATNLVEFANISSELVDVSGWRVALYDNSNFRTPRTLFTIPTGTTVAAGGLFVLSSQGTAPGTFPKFYTGQTVNWATGGGIQRVGIALLNPASNVVDFVNATQVLPSDITNPAPVGVEQWLSGGIGTATGLAPSYQRIGHADWQNTNDWIVTTNSIGQWNARLSTPFASSLSRLSTTPVRFTNTSSGTWTGIVSVLEVGTNVLLAARDAKGHYGLVTGFDVKPRPVVFVDVPKSLNEGDTVSTNVGFVRLQKPVGTNVIVYLNAAPPGKLNLPGSVMIPAGFTEMNFPIQAPEDVALTGPIQAIVGGTAEGYEVLPASIMVFDNELTAIALALPPELSEGTTATATLTLGAPLPQALQVMLRSSDSATVRVPYSVTVPIGVTNVNFNLTAVEDDILTGSQTVQVIAEVGGWLPASANVHVTDNETTTLIVELPAPIAEGGGVNNSGTIRLSGRANQDVLVNLVSDDESELNVPPTVTILAGQSSGSFAFTVEDDAEKDGIQTVHVQATAPGLTAGVATVQVADNDPHHFQVAVTSDPKFAGSSFPVTITAFDVNNALVPAFATNVTFSASGNAGALTVSPGTSGNFANSSWPGRVTISEADGDAHLSVEWNGAQGVSDSFRVQPNPVVREVPLAVADIVWNPTSQKLLASVAETDPNYSNSVVAINPQTGAIEDVLPVGRIMRLSAIDSPGEGRLALSADGQTLYVGIGGPTNIQQFNLNTKTLIRQFPVGTNDAGEIQSFWDLQVLPLNPDRLVAARTDGLAMYQAGSLLPGRGPMSSHVMVAPDNVTGFSYMGLNLGDMLFRYQLTGGGISNTEILPKSGIWFAGDVKLKDGLIYFSSGHVYNPTTHDWAGKYAIGGMANFYNDQGRFEFSAEGKWIWFISGDWIGGQFLDIFDRSTFRLVRRLDLTSIPGTVYRLSQCGPVHLALHNGGAVYFLQSSLLQPVGQPADLALGYAALSPFAVTGQPFTYRVSVTNLGPSVATDVILDNALPVGTEHTAALLSQGRWEVTGNAGRAVFGTLPPGGIAAANITITPRHGGWFTNDLVVLADEWDPVSANSRVLPVTSTRLGLGPDDSGFIPIVAGALAYDPSRGRLYASIGPNGGPWANRILIIQADTGEITGSLNVGQSPGKMTVSLDGHYLYTAIETNLAVRRFNLETGQPDIYFALGRTPDNLVLSALDLRAVPGHPESVAILQLAPGTVYGGIAIYDNTVRRPELGLNFTDVISQFIEFNESGSLLFGGNNFNDSLEILTVSLQGTTMTNRVWGLIGSGTLDLPYSSGFLYTSDGRIIDPLATNLVGILPVQSGNQLVAVHPAAGRLCYLRAVPQSPATLIVFNQMTRQDLGSMSIIGTDDFIGEVVPMLQDRLAFRLYNGKIFFVRSSRLLSPDADLDGDGMADVWEVQNGLDRTNPNDGNLDADGDGLTNQQEFLAGTNPHDAASVLRWEQPARQGGSLVCRFFALSNRTYSVQHTPTLSPTVWSKFLDVGPAPANRWVDITNSSSSGFFRIVTPSLP